MEAKTWQDTVMSSTEQVKFTNNNTDSRGGMFHSKLPNWVEDLIKHQAEITWNACLSQHPDLVAERKKIGYRITSIQWATPMEYLQAMIDLADKLKRGEGVDG